MTKILSLRCGVLCKSPLEKNSLSAPPARKEIFCVAQVFVFSLFCARKGEVVEPLGRDRSAPKVHFWGLIGVGVKKLVVLPQTAITADICRDHCLKKIIAAF